MRQLGIIIATARGLTSWAASSRTPAVMAEAARLAKRLVMVAIFLLWLPTGSTQAADGPSVDRSNPEAVGRAFIQAWTAQDRQAMEGLTDEPQVIKFAVSNPLVEPWNIRCHAWDRFTCDLYSEGMIFAILVDRADDGYTVGWASIVHPDPGDPPIPQHPPAPAPASSSKESLAPMEMEISLPALEVEVAEDTVSLSVAGGVRLVQQMHGQR